LVLTISKTSVEENRLYFGHVRNKGDYFRQMSEIKAILGKSIRVIISGQFDPKL